MDEPLDSMPGLAKCRVRDLPEGIVFGDLDSVFSRALAQIAETSVGAAAVVVNSFEALEAAVLPHLPALHPRFLFVPSTLLKTPPDNHQPDPHGCLPFLNRSAAPAVYVAFGSVAALPPAELTALAEALEASPFRFVWSLNEAKQRGLPDGFEERTRGKGVVVPWAPQPAVLAHPATGAFVTHCGWSSVLEGVAARVPLVCRPFFGDQRLNGRAAAAVWGVAVGVEGERLSKDGVVRALEAVMVGEEGRKMRDRAGLLKVSAMEAVGEGGSSERNLVELVDVVLTGKTTVLE